MKVYADSLRVDCGSLDLAEGCSLTREGVSIENVAPTTQTVYVDAGYSSGGDNGSVLKPYQSLTAALTAKLVDTSTVNYIFKVAPGTYTSGISITHTHPAIAYKTTCFRATDVLEAKSPETVFNFTVLHGQLPNVPNSACPPA